MSFTDLGTLIVAPLRSFSFLVFNEVPADLVFSTTSSATSWPFVTAFCVEALVALAAFDAPFLAFDEVFFAAAAAFSLAFLAAAAAFPLAFFAAEAPFAVADFTAVLVALAALAAAWTFFATASVRPAFFRSLVLALAIFAMVLNFAAFNLFAVALPTPGRDVISDALPDMCFTGC